MSDHVIFPRSATGSYPGGRFPHPPDKPYLEPVTVLAAAAVCTSRARLGASVFILGHRARWSWPRCSPASTRSPTAGSSAGSGSAGGRRSSRSWACPSTRAAGTATRPCARSRPSGPRTTRASTASSSASATWASRPSRCRSRTRPSGWAATARARSGARGHARRRLGRDLQGPRPAPGGPRPPARYWSRRQRRLRDIKTIELSVRYSLSDGMLGKGAQMVIDQLGE